VEASLSVIAFFAAVNKLFRVFFGSIKKEFGEIGGNSSVND
jgi:hypothetical protein